MIERILSLVAVVPAFLGTISIIGKGALSIHQSDISMIMLSYEEQKRHKTGVLIGFIVAFFALSLVMGIGASIVSSTYKNNNSPKRTMIEDQEVVNYSNSSDMAVVLIVVAFLTVLAIVCTTLIYKKEHRNPLYTDLCNWTRYATVTVYVLLSFMVLSLNLLAGLVIDASKYLYLDLVISFGFSIVASMVMSAMSIESYKEMASMKTIYNNRIVYIYYKNDDIFVSGDHILLDKCNSFYMISQDNISKLRLSPVRKDDEVYLKKRNVEILHFSANSEDSINIIRNVINDCKENSDGKIVLTANSRICCSVDKKKKVIKYTVDDCAERECKLQELDLNHWPQNVLLF